MLFVFFFKKSLLPGPPGICPPTPTLTVFPRPGKPHATDLTQTSRWCHPGLASGHLALKLLDKHERFKLSTYKWQEAKVPVWYQWFFPQWDPKSSETQGP